MTDHQDAIGPRDDYIIARLEALSALYGRTPEPRRYALYADRLNRFPLFALKATFDLVEREDDDRYPSLGRIVAQMRTVLQENDILEAPDAAFRRVRREVSRLAPPTRTEVAFSSPAIAACVAAMGGAAAFKVAVESPHDQTFDIARGAFLTHYARECMSDEHLAFVARHGTYAMPAPVRGLELPQEEVAQLVGLAAAQGRPLPDWLIKRQAALPSGLAPERAVEVRR